jgi:hypothetical protein
MEFYMVRHYMFDGDYTHDYDDIIPFPDSFKAMEYLLKRAETDLEYYIWETGEDGYKLLMNRGPGRYAYDYYYLEQMEMGVEL